MSSKIICNILLFLGVFVFLTNCTQAPVYYVEPPCETELVSINILDRNGFSETISNSDRLKNYLNVDFLKPQPYQKVLRVYARNLDGNICAFITTYYENSQPKQYLEVVNNRALGKFKEWYASGTPKIEAYVVGGQADINNLAERSWLFDGVSQVWEENGKLKATIPYEKGVLEGVTIHYHPNGLVHKKIPYHQNALEGTYEVYNENGDLTEAMEFSEGQLHGSTKMFRVPLQLCVDEQFVEGQLITGNYYSPSGKLVGGIIAGKGFKVVFNPDQTFELHEYNQGFPEGEVRVFSRIGQLTQTYFKKNGSKFGEEIVYYKVKDAGGKLQPKLSLNWADGRIQGSVVTWYDNGVMQAQREMSNNQKNGLVTAWYKDGSVMLVEEYEKDKLIKGEYFKNGETYPISEVADGKGTVTIYDENGHFMQKVSYMHGVPED